MERNYEQVLDDWELYEYFFKEVKKAARKKEINLTLNLAQEAYSSLFSSYKGLLEITQGIKKEMRQTKEKELKNALSTELEGNIKDLNTMVKKLNNIASHTISFYARLM